MDKRLIVYGVLFFLLLGFIVYVDASAPKPVNWTPTYSTKDKIPFGLYVLDKEAGSLFKGQDINKFSETPYEFFDAQYDYDNQVYNVSGTFMAIEETSTLDPESINELITFARNGNTVFLSAKMFPKPLLDSLEIKINNKFYYKDSIAFTVEKPGNVKQYFAEGISLTAFDSLNSDRVLELGHQYIDTLKKINFIKVNKGAGSFILHTQPAVFTNFHLLKGNHYQYAQDVLGALPKSNIYWYTTGYGYGEGEPGSPMQYILSQPALRWAYWLALIVLVIFFFFNAKRKQRIIPEVEPVKNTTVDFAKTIGNLYYQEKNHHTIIEKKIIYFLEKVRREYMIDTYSLDDAFVEKLHLKTGADKEAIQKTVQLIKKHRHQFVSTETDVIELNKAIEKLGL
jgi:hypothetical protein